MHIEMMDVMRSADELVEIEAFRQAAKTTKFEEHVILAGCFHNYDYMLIIGETYEKAVQRLAAIDYECRTNKALHQLFAGKVLARKSIENKMYFASGTVVQILGWEQEFQSFKELSERPDFAYMDDVENLERVRDGKAVDASMQKLYLDLMPAMNKDRRKIINGQTRRAEDCMVTRLATNEEWLYRGYPICNGDADDPRTVSAWPQRYPMEWIRKEKARYQKSGMLSHFLQAYMLQAVNPETKPFKDEMLQAMDVSPYHWMPRFAIYDPSRTSHQKRTLVNEKSDQYGKVVVSRMGSKILIHESSGRYLQPNEFINDLFLTNAQHHPAKFAIEKNSLDDWLMQPIRLEMMRRGVSLPVKALNAPQDRNKDQFIMGLQPFAQAGDVVLVGGRSAHPQLVAEWCNFPSGSRNIMNALAYAVVVFSGVPMYEDFSGANISEAPNPRLGETIYVGFNATPAEVVGVALVRDGRRLCVAADWSHSGAINDAIKTLAFEVRTTFPRATLQAWVPADVYDQWQRVSLVPALRAEKLTPYRAEHIAVARGCLAERMRNTWHNQRLFVVDRKALLTLNALSTGYALPTEKGGRQSQEPEPGVSRLIAEAIECMVAMLDKTNETADGFPKGANIAHTPSGAAYVSANPRRA